MSLSTCISLPPFYGTSCLKRFNCLHHSTIHNNLLLWLLLFKIIHHTLFPLVRLICPYYSYIAVKFPRGLSFDPCMPRQFPHVNNLQLCSLGYQIWSIQLVYIVKLAFLNGEFKNVYTDFLNTFPNKAGDLMCLKRDGTLKSKELEDIPLNSTDLNI